LTLARNKGYVVLTHDLDFSAILATTCGSKPSVVQIRSGDVSPEGIGSMVIGALRQMAAELEQGALLTIDPGRMRLRLLPLHQDGQDERL
jgi:predicted nuclease of predicted toxin-antitoxin system